MRNEKERKNELLTIRITYEEKDILDYLCDSLGKSVSDTITRAYTFLLNANSLSVINENDDRKIRKECQVHARITSSDRDRLESYGRRYGESVSQVIRRAIREFGETFKYRY